MSPEQEIKVLNSILEELRYICQDLGEFPTQAKLEQLKKYNLLYRIQKSELKLSFLAIELGYQVKRKPKNHWNEETIMSELKKVCEFEGGWPTGEMWEKKYNNLKNAIARSNYTSHDYLQTKLGITNIAGNVEKPCLYCEKEFLPSVAGGNWKRQKFCSNECLVNYHRIEQNKENALKIKQPKICPICSQEFIPNTTTKQKYCENNCFRKFRKRIGKALRRSFEAIGTLKQDISYKILGYTPEDLLKHLQSYPDWQKISNNKWDLDHIFPVKAFIDKNIFDPKLINCLDNLQPLPRKDNLSKADKYDSEAFEIWLKNKLNPS